MEKAYSINLYAESSNNDNQVYNTKGVGMKYKVKLFIFGVKTFMIFCIVSTMIFTRIYNGSYFSIFHQFDKQEHLILKKKISNRDSIIIFERGEPVLFKKNHLEIRLSNRIDAIDIDIDNAGKPLTKKNIDIIQRQDSIEITIHKNDGKTIVYKLNEIFNK